MKRPKVVSIRQNRYDNWRGYVGGRYVREFGESSTQTAQQAATQWLREESVRQYLISHDRSYFE